MTATSTPLGRTTAGATPAARARRRAGRRPDRRRRDELPRLPDAAAGRRRRRPMPSTASSTRGPGRCRRASPPRSCSSPASASRCSPAASIGDPAAVRSPPRGRSCAGPRAVRRRAAARRDLGRHDPAVLRRHVRRRRRAVHAAHAAGSSPSAPPPPSPARAIAWWRLEQRLDGTRHRRGSTRPDRASPRGLVLDVVVNGTHPAAAVAGVPLRRHRPRPRASGAPGGDRSAIGARRGAVRAGDGRSGRRRAATAATCWQHRPVEPQPGLHGQRARHRAGRVRRHHVARRAVHRRRGSSRWLARRRHDEPDAVRRCHALVFKLVVNQLGWIRPTGLDTALVFAGCYWVVGITAAVLVAPALRHRPVRVGLPPARRLSRPSAQSSWNVLHRRGSPVS